MAQKTGTTGNAPAPTIPYKVGDEEKKILMSFGLLNLLANKIGTLERVFTIGADFALNEMILSEVLTLDDKGRPHSDKFDMFDATAQIPPDDIRNLILWVGEHLSDFFIDLMDKNISRLEGHQKKLGDIKDRGEKIRAALEPSSNGLTG